MALKLQAQQILAFLAVGLIGLLVSGIIGFFIASNALEESFKSELNQTAHSVLNLCSTQQELLQQKVNSDLEVARLIFYSYDDFVNIEETNISITAINQFTKEAITLDVPRWEIGGIPITHHYKIVDAVKERVGGTCTIFQRIPGDHFLRISTNVQKQDGSRAIDTFIPKTNPPTPEHPEGIENEVVQTLLSGQTYYGRAYVVNADYITVYEPIKDAQGKVIGALYVGVKLQSAPSLVQSFLDIQVGDHGFAYVINSQGDILIHPDENIKSKNIYEVDTLAFMRGILEEENRNSWYNSTDYETGWREYFGQDKSQADQQMLERLAYFEPWDWLIAIAVPIEEMRQPSYTLAFYNILIAVGMIILIIITGSIFARRLVKPTLQSIDYAKKVTAGDLSQELRIQRKDEIGDLVHSLNRMVGNLRNMTIKIKESIHKMQSATEQFQQVSSDMVVTANDINTKTNEISEASVKISNSVSSVSDETDDLFDKLNNIASSYEEMSTSMSEVSSSAAKSANVATTAVEKLGLANNAVSDLRIRAQEIEEVVNIIKKIADQTNLLALNATIEAAGAGDAGKSFAVVANEVKDLSKQTAVATGDIEQKIHAIRESANSSVEALEEIASIVKEVDSHVNNIAASVEQQTVTMNEISNTTNTFINATDYVRQQIDVVDNEIKAVLSHISRLSETADDTASVANETEVSAGELNQISSNLQQLINQFKVGSQIHDLNKDNWEIKAIKPFDSED